jgi:DNA-binding MarR family transcriptional regulator
MPKLQVEPEELAQAAAAIRAIAGRLTRRLRQLHVDGDLTLPQTSVLALLERDGPSTTGELAASERISAQSMASTLSALEARGLVSRKADPADGRKRAIAITPQGRKVMLGVWQVKHKKLEESLRSGFSTAEQKTVIDALPLLERLTGMLLRPGSAYGASSKISAMRSPIITAVAFGARRTSVGMTDKSHTLRPSIPRTRPNWSTTESGSDSGPILHVPAE